MSRSAIHNWVVLLLALPWAISFSEGGYCRFSTLVRVADVHAPDAGYVNGVQLVPPDSLMETGSVCAVSADDEPDSSEVPTEEAIPPESFVLVIERATLGTREARSLQPGITAVAVPFARTDSAVRFGEVRVAPSWAYRVQSVWRRYTVYSFPVRVHAPPRLA